MNQRRVTGIALLTPAITCLAFGQGDFGQPQKPGSVNNWVGALAIGSEGAWIESPFCLCETQSLTIKCSVCPAALPSKCVPRWNEEPEP